MQNTHTGRPINFGIMCSGIRITAWEARCVRELLTLDQVHLKLIIVDDNDSQSRGLMGSLKRVLVGRSLFQLYKALFVRPPATRLVEMGQTFSEVPSIRCKTVWKDNFCEPFSEEDIASILDHDLDFILQFGFGTLQGDILDAAKYGVWSFHHDDPQRYRGELPCFWEIYNDDKVTGAILQRLTNQPDRGLVLKQGFWGTVDYSYYSNLNNILFGAAPWPAAVCQDIRNGNVRHLEAVPSRMDAPLYRTPNDLQTVMFLARSAKNRVRKWYTSLFRQEQWNIGVVEQPIHTFLNSEATPEIRWLPAPKKNTYAADPFGFVSKGQRFVIFESIDHASMKGAISLLKLNGQASLSQSKVVIDGPVHMAYPFVLEHDGDIYCIPETANAREVCLYKSAEYPQRWVKAGTILSDVAAVDSTVFIHEGRWWLMCTQLHQDVNLKLFAWHSPELLGPWEPHAGNPVKTDIRSARPGGTPFVHEGFLYRPAQDCTGIYGRRIVINRVTRLTPTEFEEEVAAVVEPQADSLYRDGLHTVSAAGDFTILDSKRLVFSRSRFKESIARRLGKLTVLVTSQLGHSNR